MICIECGKEFECKKCHLCTYREDNDCECDNCFKDMIDDSIKNNEQFEDIQQFRERLMWCGREKEEKEKVMFT